MKILLLSLRQSHFNCFIYSHGLPKGQMWYHVKGYHSYFCYPDIEGSLTGAYWSIKGEITLHPFSRFAPI